MIGLLTNAFHTRIANIAKAISHITENPITEYDLIKSANPEQKKKVKKVMDEWKAGTLHSGSKDGKKVTDYKQALAIAISEAGLHKSIEKGKKGMCSHGHKYGECKHGCEDIEKDMDDMEESVEKGIKGEGSKGGKVIGHTKSGKPIYDTASHDEHKTFNKQDHLDAKKLHEQKAAKHYDTLHNAGVASSKRRKSSELNKHHISQADQHADLAHNMNTDTSELEKYHEKDPEKFFDVVSRHYEPEDDGESEETMFNNLKKHPKLNKIKEQLDKKFKKAEHSDIDKAFEDLLGIQDPIEKAFNDVLLKGGPGSNKAGRIIGTTRSGKNVHVFKEAADYGDFEAPDHLEAYKIHMNHAAKVTGVAAINSQIRAHDHGTIARTKAAQKEHEELEASNAKGQKKANGGTATKKATPKGENKKASKVHKGLEVYCQRDDIQKAYSNILEKGDIASSLSTYSDKQPLLFSKTGKEIGEKLILEATKLAAKEVEIRAKMETLQEEIGEKPDSESASYSMKTIVVPRYSWDYYNAPRTVAVENSYGVKENVTDKTVYQLCNQYNDLGYRLMNILEDLQAIRIITENLESKKNYKLSVGQLVSLGF